MIEKFGDSWCCGKQKILLKISVMSPCTILHITKQVPDTPVKHHIGQRQLSPQFYSSVEMEAQTMVQII